MMNDDDTNTNADGTDESEAIAKDTSYSRHEANRVKPKTAKVYQLELTKTQLEILESILKGQVAVVTRRIKEGRHKRDKRFRMTENLQRKVSDCHIEALIDEALDDDALNDERMSEVLSQWTDELS